jgi:hypothetical protein
VFGSLIAAYSNGILLAPSTVQGGSGILEDVTLPDYVRFDQRERFLADEEELFGDVTVE